MLRPTTPYDELKRFLVSTPLATKILLFVVSILTIILLLVNSGEKYMLSLRLPEVH